MQNHVARTKMRFYTTQDEALWNTIKNLPSDQISRVFDRYFELMLEPISLCTDVVYEGIAEALVMLTNHRRKITIQDRNKVITTLFSVMNADREQVPAKLLSLGIERNILTDMVYTVLHDDSVFLPGVEVEPLRRHLDLLMGDLRRFRDIVLNRYIPLITKQSSSFAWGRRQNGLQIENEDAYQNFFMAAIRALDKFDANSGTLTGYMGNWLRNASHSIFSIHIGEAYSITRGVRAKIRNGEIDCNNHAVPMHDNPAVDRVHSIEGVSMREHHDESPDEQDLELNELVSALVRILRGFDRIERYRFALLAVKANCRLSGAEIEAQHKTLELPDVNDEPNRYHGPDHRASDTSGIVEG